jgi:chromosomal replication initiator protein
MSQITDLHPLWERFLETVKPHIPDQSYQTWFVPLKPLKVEEDTITIQVPSTFYYEWLEGHYSNLIKSSLFEVMGSRAQINYSVAPPDNNHPQPPSPVTPVARYFSKPVDESTQLNPRYTFDNFVEGDGNTFAKAACLAVAEAPGRTRFNPMLLYGGIGLGKTHLVQAIGNFAKQHNKIKRVLYVSSEKFTLEFIRSVRDNKSTDFSKVYRNTDLLLVDDVQFFAGKERTQMEFFHTFNTLYQAGKQIVLSADRPPKELNGVDERLLSRFHWGLITDIQPPDFETRVAILEKKSEEDGPELPQEIIHFLASHITSNVRELEGALISLYAYSSFQGVDVNLELAKKVLKDQIGRSTSKLSIEDIQEMTASHFGIPSDLLRSKTRKKEVARARQVAMYLCAIHTHHSLKSIGLLFGGRDHTTVIHARQFITSAIERDRDIKDAVDALQKKVELASL